MFLHKQQNLKNEDTRTEHKLRAGSHFVTIKNEESIADIAPLNQIKVIAFKDKGDWTLEAKYNIGKKKTTPDDE